jgi:hypothetical protein
MTSIAKAISRAFLPTSDVGLLAQIALYCITGLLLFLLLMT